MLMEPIAQYNNLSKALKEKLDERIESFGETVRYKFKIANENPDPEKYNGKIIYPRQYTLDPVKFTIRDEAETEKGKSKIKNIAIVSDLDEKGLPNRFDKVRIFGNEKGILVLNVKKSEQDRAKAMFLELHPKNENGLFPDASMYKIFARIDEVAYAKEQRQLRTLKLKALTAAQEMSDTEIMQFNSGMGWDETMDIEVIRQTIEQFAEDEADSFLKLIDGKDIEYRAVVQRALNKNKIVFDPAEYKFTDNTTKQVITVLAPNPQKTHVELMAEWLKTNGEKADKIYTRMKEMIK